MSEAELAARIAKQLTSMRSTSRFALSTFLDALEDSEVKGAALVLEKGDGHLEARVEIGVPTQRSFR